MRRNIMQEKPVYYLSTRYTPQAIAQAFIATRVLEPRFKKCTRAQKAKYSKMSPRNFLGILTKPELQIIIAWLDTNLPAKLDANHEIIRSNRSFLY